MWKRPYTFLKNNSLFHRLMLSFLLIIILQVSFNFLSFSYFKTGIRDEIVKYNSLNLNNTVESYEKQFQLIENLIVGLYFDDKMTVLQKDNSAKNFMSVNQFSQDLLRMTSNPMLNLENIVIYFNDSSITVDKDGGGIAAETFNNAYISMDYNQAFWQEQFRQSYRYRIFPAAEFRMLSTDQKVVPRGKLFPIVFKNSVNNQVYLIAFLNADKAFAAFHHSINENFYIVDGQGNTVYANNPAKQPEHADLLAFAAAGEGNSSKNNDYFFYKKGSESGLTYINVIPNENITAQVRRMNTELLLILGFVVLISIVISIVLSAKFNSPIRKIVESIQKRNPNNPVPAGIREFTIIGDTIGSMIQTAQHTSTDLRKKDSLLKNYGYINKLKNIYSSQHDVHEDLLEMDKPFYLIIFSLSFTKAFQQLPDADQKKASLYISEFIQLQFSKSFDDPVTMQIEKQMILSLIFSDTEQQQTKLTGALEQLRTIFDRDRAYCFLTIAVHPVLRSSSEFTTAYEETLEMLQQRELNADTQIITKPMPESFHPLIPVSLEQEFYVHLQAGNESTVMDHMKRMLLLLDKNNANVYQFTQFSRETVSRTIKTLSAANADISGLLGTESPYQKLKECATVDEYAQFFGDFLKQSIALIHEKKSGQDPLKDSILEYLSRHFGEEVSLESIAGRFNLSSGYLSIYFKEKTGTNFVQYLNELRITKAKELLLSTNMKMLDIGTQVGVPNANSFIRLFKKVTGFPPGEYRRMHSMEEESD
ncbi:helix-turn-helix domain-containing protein [Paenibacillus contaminans]|uniref:HTH araC/xylS-type domain-containing protein n=1 Tax=Paenibacillus contaminans TaxID=450362 RepID=A0A329MV32_9BACL|nr:helix-turn-helix domain-containing protein [Paenibacillus contaminans]RAV22523.1 hypothetical protein DQG23_06195 [Paenibacillus contaminans]